jgi:hypothetical protein
LFSKNSTKNPFTEFGYCTIPNKAAEEPWTETETKINDWLKPMATSPYSRAFQNKTGLQADLHGNGMP